MLAGIDFVRWLNVAAVDAGILAIFVADSWKRKPVVSMLTFVSPVMNLQVPIYLVALVFN